MFRKIIVLVFGMLALSAQAAIYIPTDYQATNIILEGDPDGFSVETYVDGQFLRSGNILTGYLSLEANIAKLPNFAPIESYNYTADWIVDLDSGTLLASNIICEDDIDAAFQLCFTLFPSNFSSSINSSGDLQIQFDVGAGPEATGTFIFTSEVPIPAAAWLFGSALIGLAGIGRKRRA